MLCFALITSSREKDHSPLRLSELSSFFLLRVFLKFLLTQLEGLWIKALASVENDGRFANLGYINEIWFDNVKGCEPMH